MGRAKIIGGGTYGLYTIERVQDDGLYQQMRARLEARIAELDDRIAALDGEISDAEAAVDNADDDVRAAQDAYVQAVQSGEDASDERAALTEAMTAMTEAAGVRNRLRARRSLARNERTQDQRHLDRITAQDPGTESAWCVDLTEDASGDVATIEVPGEPQAPLLIAPGARPPATADGILTPREWMSPEQAYFNAAILPGWQRHHPMYRLGTITAVYEEANTADVSLDAHTSTAQGLGVDAVSSLSAVPVSYMSCDAAAFESGDRVVVAFGGAWDSPTVIGFESEPKPCIEWPDKIEIDIFFEQKDSFWIKTEDWETGSPDNEKTEYGFVWTRDREEVTRTDAAVTHEVKTSFSMDINFGDSEYALEGSWLMLNKTQSEQIQLNTSFDGFNYDLVGFDYPGALKKEYYDSLGHNYKTELYYYYNEEYYQSEVNKTKQGNSRAAALQILLSLTSEIPEELKLTNKVSKKERSYQLKELVIYGESADKEYLVYKRVDEQ